MLGILTEFYCLRPKDIANIRRKREPTEHDIRAARATLSLLLADNLVCRFPFYETDRTFGTISYVYGLTDKAVKMIGDPARPFSEHSVRTIDHELEISLFHIKLKKLCEQKHLELFWYQEGINVSRGINPDAFFAITDPSKPEGRNTNYFFLEIERSKIGNFKNGEPSITRKLTKYYEYFDSDACENDWNFRKFRVVIVQPSAPRSRNLLETLAEKYQNRMFWLTTEPAYKENIGGEIFRTPKDYSKVAYSFLSL